MIHMCRWELWEIDTLRAAMGDCFAGDRSKAISEVARIICRSERSVRQKAMQLHLYEPAYYAGDRELEQRSRERQGRINASFFGR